MVRKKEFLIDTSVILDDPQNILNLYQDGNNKVIVTNVILAELDKHKEGRAESSYFARTFFRLIAASEGKDLSKSPFQKSVDGDFIREMELQFDSGAIPIYVIYRTNYKHHQATNDEKIGEVAKDYGFTLITNDIAFKIRSLTKGINTQSIYKDSEKDPTSLQFFKSFKIGKDTSELAARKEFKELFNWTMIEAAQTLDGKIESGKKFFGLKVQNGFEELDLDDIITQTNPYIAPINLEQKFFYSMLIHPANQITVCTGSTGSGKTLIALQAGLYLQKQGIVDGIVYIRNTVTSADKEAELGFRKGDQGQKLGFFMYPLYAVINFTIEKIRKESWDNAQEYTGETNAITRQEATDKFIANHNIEMMDIAHARGTTITKKFVIFDEAQNVSNATLKLIGTRMGKDSRLVVLGDWKQIDHPYLTKERNGLITLLSKAAKSDMVAGIHLAQTIRSEVAKWFDEEFN